MFFLALTHGLGTLSGVLWLTVAHLRIGTGILTKVSLVILVLGLLGLAILLPANVAPKQFNPWPRRLMFITMFLSHASILAFYIIYFANDLYSTGVNIGVLALVIAAWTGMWLGWLFAVLYASQLAHWLRSRRLAIASTIVFGAAGCIGFAGALKTVLPFLGIVTLLNLWVDWALQIANLLSTASLAAYFLVIAICLWRYPQPARIP
jgi:hypothetical protein